jgi:hypothetical protein
VLLFAFNDKAWYALSIFVFGGFAFAIWEVFLRSKQEEIKNLKETIKQSQIEKDNLHLENIDLRNRRLNITDIRHIIDLSLIELDTSFTKTYNEEIENSGKKMKFVGALKVDIIAKYGIDLNELMFKFPEGDENTVKVANVNPKFLAFKSRNFNWEIAEILALKKSLLSKEHWRSDINTKSILNHICEQKRTQLESEMNTQPSDMEWIIAPLRKHITTSLALVLENGQRQVEICEDFDSSFVEFNELKKLH